MFFEGEWKPAGPLWACEVAASVSKGSVSSTLCRGDNMSFSRSQNVLVRLDPRLSGLDLAYAEAHLSLILNDLGRWLEQIIDCSAVHEVGADQPGEDDRAWNGFLGGLGKAQQQEGDQCDRNLDAYGILGGADKASDLEGLLDPAEEQLNGPAAAIEIGEFLGAGIEIVRQDAQYLAGVVRDPNFAHRVLHWVVPASGLTCRKEADAIGEDVAVRRDQ